MLLGLATLLALASVPLFGGRLGALGDLRFRSGWLLAVALGLQIVVIEVFPDMPPALASYGHILSYLYVAAAVYANRHVPFLWLIALGGLSNAAAIFANHGVMPASETAQATAGIVVDPGEFANSAALSDPHLAFLGDVFAIPASWPAANVFSVGDVLIAAGLLAGLHVICRSRLAAIGLRAQRGEARLQEVVQG